MAGPTQSCAHNLILAVPEGAGGSTIALDLPLLLDDLIADPAVVLARSLRVATIISLNTFLTPDTVPMTWSDAAAYCKSKLPAARLPTQAELQHLFLSATSAKVAGDFNIEMCSVHNWPIGGHCGGSKLNYWSSTPAAAVSHFSVSLISGIAYPTSNSGSIQVACVR